MQLGGSGLFAVTYTVYFPSFCFRERDFCMLQCTCTTSSSDGSRLLGFQHAYLNWR